MAYPKITKRKDGRFEAKVSIGKDPNTGKPVRKSVFGKTKTEVKKNIDQLTKDVIKGKVVPTANSHCTVEQWCNDWLTVFASRLSQNTYVKYKGHVNLYIIPLLGNIELQKLTPLDCQQFINYLVDNTHLHPNTINYIITCLKSILNKAITMGLLGKNPAVDLIKPKNKKPQINPFTENEALLFLDHCQNNTYDNLCKFAIYTGLREAEIMALTWDNLLNNEIIVDHQFARDKKDKTFYPTKNNKLRRVGLSKSAIEVLENQKRIQANLQISCGKNYRNPLNLIFTDKTGDRLHKNTVYRHFKVIATKIGRPDVRFHDLRHTYAVFALKAGVDIKTISESLGHHSVSFTLDQYAYVTANMREDSARKLEDYISTLNAYKSCDKSATL